MKVKKYVQNKGYQHKEGTEWLTKEICEHYYKKAEKIKDHSLGNPEFKRLCKDLVERCDITETQAINILNGYHFNDYVAIYERYKNPTTGSGSSEMVEYLHWLAEKEDEARKNSDFDMPDLD